MIVAPPDYRKLELETIQEYALGQLSTQNELREIQIRHALYYVTLAEEALPQMDESGERAWPADLVPDHDNLRAVLENMFRLGETQLLKRLAVCRRERVRGTLW